MSVAAIMAICINIPFNYLLIFKLNLGISGAAMASSLAEFGAFIVLLLYMWVRVDKVKYQQIVKRNIDTDSHDSCHGQCFGRCYPYQKRPES